MEEPRDSFVFYRSFRSALDYLSDADHRTLVNMILDSALDRKDVTSDNHLVMTFFNMIKPQLDANYRKAKNGIKGGRPPKHKKPDEKTIGSETGNHRLLKSETIGSETGKPNVNANANDYTPNQGNNILSVGGRGVMVDENGRWDVDTGEAVDADDCPFGKDESKEGMH